MPRPRPREASTSTKQARIAELGWVRPERLRYAPCDFENTDFLDALGSSGFNATRTAVVSWLGVALYLTREAIVSILTRIAALAPGSELTLSYLMPPEDQSSAGLAALETSAGFAASSGEGFKSMLHEPEIEELLRRAGFNAFQHYRPDELNARLFGGRSDSYLHELRPSCRRVYWLKARAGFAISAVRPHAVVQNVTTEHVSRLVEFAPDRSGASLASLASCAADVLST